jgi:hypothetical protein
MWKKVELTGLTPVASLEGAALDWAVAKCLPDDTVRIYFEEETGEKLFLDDWEVPEFSPSTDWAQGGLIIEREGIALDCLRTCFVIDSWVAASEMVREGDYDSPVIKFTGPTPLIAAMRCYVASQLGDEVEVPSDLM